MSVAWGGTMELTEVNNEVAVLGRWAAFRLLLGKSEEIVINPPRLTAPRTTVIDSIETLVAFQATR